VFRASLLVTGVPVFYFVLFLLLAIVFLRTVGVEPGIFSSYVWYINVLTLLSEYFSLYASSVVRTPVYTTIARCFSLFT
jgi:hypothetical protein